MHIHHVSQKNLLFTIIVPLKLGTNAYIICEKKHMQINRIAIRRLLVETLAHVYVNTGGVENALLSIMVCLYLGCEPGILCFIGSEEYCIIIQKNGVVEKRTGHVWCTAQFLLGFHVCARLTLTRGMLKLLWKHAMRYVSAHSVVIDNIQNHLPKKWCYVYIHATSLQISQVKISKHTSIIWLTSALVWCTLYNQLYIYIEWIKKC